MSASGYPCGGTGPFGRYDPRTVEEVIAVMHSAGDSAHGRRLRALIVIRRGG